ncbi:MAG: hypothetical protein WAL91_10150 [Propionicimonas sp.]
MTETPEQAAARLAQGPLPSAFVPGGADASPPAESPAPFDPLRLCIFATIATQGWLFGPLAVLVFAGVGFAGYWKARQAGLTRSKCYLRDTRLVLAYLFLLAAAGAWGLVLRIQNWLF